MAEKTEKEKRVIIEMRKTRVLVMAALCVVAIVAAVLPHSALAYEPEVRVVREWRGSGTASLWVYGQTYEAANEPFVWMEVHAYLYKQGSGQVASNVNGYSGKGTLYLATTARYTVGYADHGTFQTHGDFYWDYDGYSFGADHKDTDWQYM